MYPSKQDTMATIPGSGTSAVYIGFWLDHDAGYFLTLANRNAATLLAFLAITVTFASSRSWKLVRFVLYQHLCLVRGNQGQSMKPARRLQVILRNTAMAPSTLWASIELLWSYRRRISASQSSESLLLFNREVKSMSRRATLLSIISSIHLAGFAAAGILTSRILIGRTVVSRVTPTCGQWTAKNLNYSALSGSPELLTYISQRLNESMDADNYVRNCYPMGVSRGILDCGKFFTRALPYQLEHDAPCPFGSDLCSDRPNDAFVMDSGPILFRDLGINSKFAQSLSVQRRSTCAVVPDAPFFQDFGGPDGTSRSYRFTSGPPANPLDLWYRSDITSGTYHLQTLYQYHQDANTSSELIRPDPTGPDSSVILLRSNGVRFLTTYDDPWFSVHTQLKYDNSTGALPTSFVRYITDNFLNIIACKEATRFCSMLSNNCSAWTGIVQTDAIETEKALLSLVGSRIQTNSSDFQEIVNSFVLVSLSLHHTSLSSSVEDRHATSALQAARYLDGTGVQLRLEPEQWKIELEYWFAMALARLQLEIFNTIEKPPWVDESVASNSWEGKELKKICGKVKFYSGNHMTLSTVGIVAVLALVGFLTLASMLDVFLGWIPTEWGKSLIEEWNEMENLRLLDELDRDKDEVGQTNNSVHITHETK